MIFTGTSVLVLLCFKFGFMGWFILEYCCNLQGGGLFKNHVRLFVKLSNFVMFLNVQKFDKYECIRLEE